MLEVAEEWLDQSRSLHLEGVVAKRVSEPYRHGKRSWVKVKHFETVDLVVGGCAGAPNRLSLLLGAYDEDRLTYVGQITAISGHPCGRVSQESSKRSSATRASGMVQYRATAAWTATARGMVAAPSGARV
jgi:ATP-dependent DNA ligase